MGLSLPARLGSKPLKKKKKKKNEAQTGEFVLEAEELKLGETTQLINIE